MESRFKSAYTTLRTLILDGLAFIPGSWASYNLIGAIRGWTGFSYRSVPSYD